VRSRGARVCGGWARRVSNLRPLACEQSGRTHLPLPNSALRRGPCSPCAAGTRGRMRRHWRRSGRVAAGIGTGMLLATAQPACAVAAISPESRSHPLSRSIARRAQLPRRRAPDDGYRFQPDAAVSLARRPATLPPVLRVALTLAATAALAVPAPAPASEWRSCGRVRVGSATTPITFTVKMRVDDVGCRTARRVVNRTLFGQGEPPPFGWHCPEVSSVRGRCHKGGKRLRYGRSSIDQ
jgi:hypothetical protein